MLTRNNQKPSFYLRSTKDSSISLISTSSATTRFPWSSFANKDLSVLENVYKFSLFLYLNSHLSLLSIIWPYHQPLGLQATQLGLNDISLQQVFPLAFVHGLHKFNYMIAISKSLFWFQVQLMHINYLKMSIQSSMHSSFHTLLHQSHSFALLFQYSRS